MGRRRPALPLVILAVMAVYVGGDVGWKTHAQRAAPPGRVIECRVGRVGDGDTLRARCGWHRYAIRVWGIDAPELSQAPWGEQAHQRLRELAAGRQLRARVRDRDKYGRLVAQLYDGNEDLGLRLVAEGYATVYERYNRQETYLAARAAARAHHLGIWGKPGLQQRPWIWRRQHPR
jgi:endonuclease YncB( thermonuclease family)